MTYYITAVIPKALPGYQFLNGDLVLGTTPHGRKIMKKKILPVVNKYVIISNECTWTIKFFIFSPFFL